MITVRPSTPDDTEAVIEVSALATETLRETYRPKAGAYIGESRPRDLTRVVALIEGRIVGTAQYCIEGDRLHIIGLGVHPEFRRRGVAGGMIEFFVGIARRTGLRCLSLNTIVETGNVPVFERRGFEVVSQRVDEWAESDSYETLIDVYMEKVIAG